MVTNSNIIAWEISWAEQPDGLQSMGSQRVRHNLVIKQQQQFRGYLFLKNYLFIFNVFVCTRSLL